MEEILGRGGAEIQAEGRLTRQRPGLRRPSTQGRLQTQLGQGCQGGVCCQVPSNLGGGAGASGSLFLHPRVCLLLDQSGRWGQPSFLAAPRTYLPQHRAGAGVVAPWVNLLLGTLTSHIGVLSGWLWRVLSKENRIKCLTGASFMMLA